MKFESFEELRDTVQESGGVLTISMEDMRDAHGAGRLGVHVRSAISKGLQGLGLGHYPPELPAYQEQYVRVYRLGSPIADLIDAVIEPSPGRDEYLRRAVGGDAEATLAKVRELVCE